MPFHLSRSRLYLLPGGRPARRMCYLLSYHVKRTVAQGNLRVVTGPLKSLFPLPLPTPKKSKRACCQSERLLRGPAGGQAKSSSKRVLRLLVYNELYLRQCKGVRTPCRKDELCYE